MASQDPRPTAADIPLRAQARAWAAQLRTDVRTPRTARDAARLAGWGIFAFALIAPPLRATVGFQPVAFPLVVGAGVAALLLVSPRSDFRTWLFYLVSLYFFTQLRDAADETAIDASTGYVLDWERSWFGGDTPSAWLQTHVGGADGNTNVVSFLATFTHWTWFFFPHAIVLGVYLFARPMFFRVAAIMMGTFYAAVALYYLVPTVPPWLAAEQGDAEGIRRVIIDVGPQIFGQNLFDRLFDLLAEPNPRAAMPSLHFAASFIVIFLGYLLRSRRLMAIATVYSMAMSFALMYLGEHYFVDILVGGAVGGAAAFIAETALGNGPRLRARLRWRPAPPRPSPPDLRAAGAPHEHPLSEAAR